MLAAAKSQGGARALQRNAQRAECRGREIEAGLELHGGEKGRGRARCARVGGCAGFLGLAGEENEHRTASGVLHPSTTRLSRPSGSMPAASLQL